ncbi:MAG: hypothetical protein R3293_11480 [Candidatus Promineifilaceae bacterium]|nr:hypothetical protein [Candidatus Promineifilaceae bacterium]
MKLNRQVKTFVFMVLILISFMVNEHHSARAFNDSLDIEEWIVESEESHWSAAELAVVEETLLNTAQALDDAGYDGLSLLSGYHFRRQHQEFVDDIDGRIALVRHQQQEIILADTAFLRLQGYYIYHELGHVVDKRLERKLGERFHALAGSAVHADSQLTADGFWLNEHARTDQQEATADAFALWVVLNYTDNYKPVFWNTPYAVSYEMIVETMDRALGEF